MLFISTPTFVISLILAVFYVANLAFYAVNRHLDKEQTVEIISQPLEKENFPQPISLLSAPQEQTIVVSANYSILTDEIASLNTIFDDFCLFLPEINPSILHTGIFWKLFSRPPPLCNFVLSEPLC